MLSRGSAWQAAAARAGFLRRGSTAHSTATASSSRCRPGPQRRAQPRSVTSRHALCTPVAGRSRPRLTSSCSGKTSWTQVSSGTCSGRRLHRHQLPCHTLASELFTRGNSRLCCARPRHRGPRPSGRQQLRRAIEREQLAPAADWAQHGAFSWAADLDATLRSVFGLQSFRCPRRCCGCATGKGCPGVRGNGWLHDLQRPCAWPAWRGRRCLCHHAGRCSARVSTRSCRAAMCSCCCPAGEARCAQLADPHPAGAAQPLKPAMPMSSAHHYSGGHSALLTRAAEPVLPAALAHRAAACAACRRWRSGGDRARRRPQGRRHGRGRWRRRGIGPGADAGGQPAAVAHHGPGGWCDVVWWGLM
jgi:hypothetical protein